MIDFFFAPIREVVSNHSSCQSLWNSISLKRLQLITQMKINICGKVFNSSGELKEYLLLLHQNEKVIDLRNLYVYKIKSTAIKLIQENFVIELVFQNKNIFKEFMNVARRYIIRTDMDKVYKFNLETNNDRVGAGGFGDVRLIKHRKTRITYALKSVYKKKVKNKRSSANSMRYMTNEIDYLRILEHPNMLRFEELYEDEHYIHIITELLNAGTVSDKNQKKMTVFEACFVLKSILELLVYLAENHIAHRDIKPGNIMFHRTKDNKVICKLIDFGLCADARDKSSTTLLKDRAGTVCYLAPELIECNPDKGYYDTKVDVFSISMVFWELLTGKNPIRVPRRKGEQRRKSKEYR